MGKKGSWFGSVKKVFSPESKSKKKGGSEKHEDPSIETTPALAPVPAPPPPPPEEVKVAEAQNEQSKQAYTVAVATAAAAEAAVAAAQAAAEVVRLSNFAKKCPGKSKEEVAVIRIQTAFRGYLARRALRALRGLVRLKTLIEGQSVKRQSATTLRCMQTLARLQSQIHARRIRMSEENQALQRQLQLSHEKGLENFRASMGDEWDDSIQSKEQVEANLLSKHEAAIKRERAMAYAYSHQMWKNSSRYGNGFFMDPQNPHWGWSWLERWMAARPWESRSTTEKELNDHSSFKSASRSTVVGEICKAYATHELNADKPFPTVRKPVRRSPSTPSSKVPPLMAGKIRSTSPKATWPADDDSRSVVSMQSERPRRHSIAGSSVRDDESLASSPAIPSYMVPTESARAKARLLSLPNSLGAEKLETPDKGPVGSAKKRLSFSGSPTGMRRHSGPPKIDSQLIKDIGANTEQSVSNGG
ncbi:hypothetical protein Scep_004818 [Stephania cephalantha]|uniref:DUF4005 domain-containing protein n=1 Tax=Stephania cephalantha TaxID=152367 RepID=A0AAP0PXM6_9MAGN